MAPFPESESMTIKRLEVALRKDDMRLLKDGAYKLHEKFHMGHKFEFLTELNQILEYVKKNNIPEDIAEILCPTIEEILGIKSEDSEQKVPPLEINPEDVKLQGEAYEEYIAQKEAQKEQENFEKSFSENNNPQTYVKPQTIGVQNPSLKPNLPTGFFKAQTSIQTSEDKTPKAQTQGTLVFYDDNNKIDFSLIKKYNADLLKDNCTNDVLQELSMLSNLVNTQVGNLEKVFSCLLNSKEEISLVSTSQSQEQVKFLKDKDINFEIPSIKNLAEDKSNKKTINFIPLFGLFNIFFCPKCENKVIVEPKDTKTLAIQCPNCDGASFCELYSPISKNIQNPIYWQKALKSFIKSEVWILINPSFEEGKEIITDFIKTALECSSPKRIYLFTKENDKKEFYKNLFQNTLSDCDIRCEYYSLDDLREDFIKTQLTKNYE